MGKCLQAIILLTKPAQHALTALCSHRKLDRVSAQLPQRICVMDLSTGAIRESPAALLPPQTPQEFGAQLSPDGSAFLLQKGKGAFLRLQLPSLEACKLAEYRLQSCSGTALPLPWNRLINCIGLAIHVCDFSNN